MAQVAQTAHESTSSESLTPALKVPDAQGSHSRSLLALAAVVEVLFLVVKLEHHYHMVVALMVQMVGVIMVSLVVKLLLRQDSKVHNRQVVQAVRVEEEIMVLLVQNIQVESQIVVEAVAVTTEVVVRRLSMLMVVVEVDF